MHYSHLVHYELLYFLGSNCKPSSSNQPPNDDDSDDEPSAGSNDPPKNQDKKQKKQPKNNAIIKRVVVEGKGKYAGTKYVGGAENQPHVHYYDRKESDGHVKIGNLQKVYDLSISLVTRFRG